MTNEFVFSSVKKDSDKPVKVQTQEFYGGRSLKLRFS